MLKKNVSEFQLRLFNWNTKKIVIDFNDGNITPQK